MKNKKKFVAVLSTATISTLIATALAPTMAYAAEGDIYNISNKDDVKVEYTKKQTQNFKNQKHIGLHSQNYGYEHNGKVYKFDELTKYFGESGEDFDKAMKSLEEKGEVVKDVEELNKVEVEAVSAITSKNVTVTFKAPVTEAQAKETTIVLVKGDVEYSATAALEKDAKEATFTFAKALTEDGEYTLKGTEVKAELTEFADADDAAIAKKVVDAKDLIELRTALSNKVFKDVNSEQYDAYQNILSTLKADNNVELKTTKDIQDKVIYEVNVVKMMKDAVKLGSTANSEPASDTDTKVDELKLYDAISYGSEAGVLKDVDLNQYFEDGYKALVQKLTNSESEKVKIATVKAIQENIIDQAAKTATNTIVTNAKNAVKEAKEALTVEKIEAAERAIEKVPADAIEGEEKENIKESLTKQLDDIKVVEQVKDAVATGDQAKILSTIENNFDRVNPEFKVVYSRSIEIKLSQDNNKFDCEMKDIQSQIDTANEDEIGIKVADANMSLDSKKVNVARELVDKYLTEAKLTDKQSKDGSITTKQYATSYLNMEDALIAVSNAKTDNELKVALVNLDKLENELVARNDGKTIEVIRVSGAKLQKNNVDVDAKVADNFDIKTVNDNLLSQYREVIAKAEIGDKNQRSDLQNIIKSINEKSNVEIAIEAVNALFGRNAAGELDEAKLAEGVGQAEIDAANKLVEALPEDKDEVTTKADLKAKIATAQNLVNATNVETATKAVNALFGKNSEGNVDDTKLAEKVGQAEIDAANKLVEALPDDKGEVTTKTDLKAKIATAQNLVNKDNLKVVEDAVNALFGKNSEGNVDNTKLAEEVGQAEIDAANKLVEALPDDKDEVTTKTDLKAKIATAQEILDVANINVAIESKDAVALKSQLVRLNSTKYNDLTKAQQVEVAEIMIKESKAEVISTISVKGDLDADAGIIAKYKKILGDVNVATTKTQMNTALLALNYDKYNSLDNQLDISEVILDNVTSEGFNEYKTISEIKSAIDKAIANPVKGNTITVNPENVEEDATLTIGQQ